MLRNYRKPLVIATPKIGLKHPKVVSSVSEFAPSTKFHPTLVKDYGSDIRKLVLCLVKVALDIEAAIEKKSLGHGVRVVCIEEIAPFLINDLQAYTGSLKKGTDVFWV